MSDIQEQKRPKVAPAVGQPPTVDATQVEGSQDTVAGIDKALGRVRVIHGANELSYDLAGKNVAYVREALATPLTIPKDAQALVNGQPVASEDNTILAQNDELEFIKASGTKG